ncbi:MAG TPA: ABC transporter permease [Vicinamibacterales bacterium]|nr:ABC transporter permease [Vicinamibacterales bacterium]
MSFLLETLRRAWYLINRRRFEDSLRREMEAHRAMMAEPSGFGNTLRLREEARDVWGWRWLDDVERDFRFAWRMLRRTPGVACIAVVSLALATGATTAIFSVVNGVLLQPLPFMEPDRLVQVFGRSWREDRGGQPDSLDGPVGSAELEQFALQAGSFEGFAGYAVTTVHLGGADGPERLTAVAADLSLFEVLGVPAVAGRTFRTGDPPDVAVIGARLWRERFGGTTAISGQSVRLDGRSFTILGVVPERFQFPYRAASLLPGALPEGRTDVWVPLPPLRLAADGSLRRGRVNVVARLKPGVAVPSAQAELNVVARRVEEASAGTRLRAGARIVPLAAVVVGPIRASLWLLSAAVGLVLLAACANVANVLLARMTVRFREMATRAALGASGDRLLRQLLVESLLISALGALAGAALARWAIGLLTTLGAAKIPRAHEIALDWRAFAFLLAVCVGTAVVVGLAPALVASRIGPGAVTRSMAGYGVAGGRIGRLRDGLVIVEVALAFILALGAGLVVRELVRLENVPVGMNTENVLTLHLTPRTTAHEYQEIETRVSRLPGVRTAGLAQLVPLQNWGWTGDFAIRNQPRQDRPVAGLRYVTPGYFRTIGMPLLEGRTFSGADTAGSRPVVVVNDTLVRRYLQDRDPVGLELDRGVIVGVVGDIRNTGLGQPPEPEIYYPAAQNLAMVSDIGMSLIVRAATPPAGLVEPVRAVVRGVNPNLAVFNVRTMEQVVADSLWELYLYRWLTGSFALLALSLAAIGLYGVISFGVTARIREFAVRLALGAEPSRVARQVFARAWWLTAAGLAAGVTMALALTLLLPALQVPIGLPMYAFTAGLLLILAIVSSAFPALRVARVNPASALRHE